MGTLDTGRDAVDQAVRITGKAFYQGAVNATKEALYDAVKDTAERRGLDPDYVLYVLLTHPRSWRDAAGRNADALGVARELYIAGEPKPPKKFMRPDPDEESAVDAAIADVGRWAASEFINLMTNTFVAVGREGAKMVRPALSEILGEPVSERQARNTLVEELILRVKDHPFWFRDSITLHQLLGLMFSLT